MLLVRHIPHRLKPKPQRLARTLEDRPRGRRCLTLASHTSQLAPSRHPRQASPAGRTAETIRPTNTPKKIHAGCLRREPLIEFLERAGIVDPANGMGCILDHPNILSLRERIGYPIYRILPERGRGDFQRSLLSGSGKLEWDALSLIAQEHLRAGTEPLPELTAWIIEVLAGKKPRPNTGARCTSGRDRVIYGAVWFMAKRFELPPTRNAAAGPKCCAKGGSGCDVVGAAAGVTYKTAEQAWTNRDPLLS